MIPEHVKVYFWDIDASSFDPTAYPDYTIFRILEWGDKEAVVWMRQIFSETEIRRVLSTERRLTPKSAAFWAIVYKIPSDKVAALNSDNTD